MFPKGVSLKKGCFDAHALPEYFGKVSINTDTHTHALNKTKLSKESTWPNQTYHILCYLVFIIKLFNIFLRSLLFFERKKKLLIPTKR